jgi:hypothetical protein
MGNTSKVLAPLKTDGLMHPQRLITDLKHRENHYGAIKDKSRPTNLINHFFVVLRRQSVFNCNNWSAQVNKNMPHWRDSLKEIHSAVVDSVNGEKK